MIVRNLLFGLLITAISRVTCSAPEPTLVELDLASNDYNLENVNCLHVETYKENDLLMIICNQCDIFNAKLSYSNKGWKMQWIKKVTNHAPSNCKFYDANFITDAVWIEDFSKQKIIYSVGEESELKQIEYSLTPNGNVTGQSLSNISHNLSPSNKRIGNIRGLLYMGSKQLFMAGQPHSSRHLSGNSILLYNETITNVESLESSPYGLCSAFTKKGVFMVVTKTGLLEMKSAGLQGTLSGREGAGQKVVAISEDRVVIIPLKTRFGVSVVRITETTSDLKSQKYFQGWKFTGLDFDQDSNTLFLSTERGIFMSYNATETMALPDPKTTTTMTTTTTQQHSTTQSELLTTTIPSRNDNVKMSAEPPANNAPTLWNIVNFGIIVLIAVVISIILFRRRKHPLNINAGTYLEKNDDDNSIQSSEFDSTNGEYQRMSEGHIPLLIRSNEHGARFSGIPQLPRAPDMTSRVQSTNVPVRTEVTFTNRLPVRTNRLPVGRSQNQPHPQSQGSASTVTYEGAESTNGTIITSKGVRQQSLFNQQKQLSSSPPAAINCNTKNNISPSPEVIHRTIDNRSSSSTTESQQSIEITDPELQEALSLNNRKPVYCRERPDLAVLKSV